jgi:hypothetical protein
LRTSRPAAIASCQGHIRCTGHAPIPRAAWARRVGSSSGATVEHHLADGALACGQARFLSKTVSRPSAALVTVAWPLLVAWPGAIADAARRQQPSRCGRTPRTRPPADLPPPGAPRRVRPLVATRSRDPRV